METNTQEPETGSSIPAYQQRVLEEHSALKARNNALLALLQNPKPDAITDHQWQLLNEQYACMESYRDVLEARLVDFGLDSLPGLEGYVLALCIHNNDMALAQSLEPFDPNNTVNS